MRSPVAGSFAYKAFGPTFTGGATAQGPYVPNTGQQSVSFIHAASCWDTHWRKLSSNVMTA